MIVWTLVAIGAFLLSVFWADPTSIGALPRIPGHLLELSGVSSAVYLVGKAVRSPGPIIDEIVATVGSFELEILGRNLSPSAGVQIQGISVSRFLDPTKHEELRPIAVNPDPGTGFSRTLYLKLIACHQTWLGQDSLEVTVTNPDGQKAIWTVKLDDALRAQLAILPPSLTSARPLS